MPATRCRVILWDQGCQLDATSSSLSPILLISSHPTSTHYLSPSAQRTTANMGLSVSRLLNGLFGKKEMRASSVVHSALSHTFSATPMYRVRPMLTLPRHLDGRIGCRW